MSLPLFDDIDLPPNAVLVDVNGIEDLELRQQYQGAALGAWGEATGEALPVRDWDDNEGIFVVMESGVAIGVAIVTDVEGL